MFNKATGQYTMKTNIITVTVAGLQGSGKTLVANIIHDALRDVDFPGGKTKVLYVAPESSPNGISQAVMGAERAIVIRETGLKESAGQLYTCVSKPGEYEMVGTSSGAGNLKGLPVIVYRDAQNGRLFHREPENFMARMKKIQPEQSDINAELLAALEDIIKQSEDASDPYGVWLNSCVENAKAVVAKAKGGAE